MTCCKCDAVNANVRLTQIFNGVSNTRDFCEDCAPNDMKERTQQIQNGTFDPEAEWQAKWEKLHAEYPQFAAEAYSFVHKSMGITLRKNAQSQQGSRNISEVIEGCQDYAKEMYGTAAKARLKSWGIETFLDVGEIFILKNTNEAKGIRDPALEERLEKMYETMRKSLRQKYGSSSLFPDNT